MNIHTRNVNTQPDQNAVEEALDILRNWVGHADETEIASLDADLLAQILPQQYPEFSASYNSDFTVNEAYRDSMPDLQNGPTALIRGAKQQIQHVGISKREGHHVHPVYDGMEQWLLQHHGPVRQIRSCHRPIHYPPCKGDGHVSCVL